MVIVTEWAHFRGLDLVRLKKEMAGPVVVDLRNIYNAQEIQAFGFIYEGVGRGGGAFNLARGRMISNELGSRVREFWVIDGP